ncbi:MAG: hypothetical protein HYR64_06790 [Fimbriimonas ginsengisoli]|uniref:Uncharacterized protein n=1 Tax=Fimbriimonas ginsengisoli TaxID=1005039 RepID=A0A931PWM8_FIMGI|nr:hypothetical protein [Fimbriimonas ginsengisoli]
MKKLAQCALIVLGYLIAFDLIGVLVSSLVDVTPLRWKSPVLTYAIWFVLGVFCGLLSYNSAGSRIAAPGEGDWSTRPDARKTGLAVIAAASIVLLALALICNTLVWSGGGEGDLYVPDSRPLTIVYLATILISMVFANAALLSPPSKTQT